MFLFTRRLTIYLKRNNLQNTVYEENPPILEECYAKIVSTDGDLALGLTVKEHCYLVGLVAKELVSRQPKRIQNLLFPKGVELVAASHDVGKVNPHFQEKLRRLLPNYKQNSISFLSKANPDIEKNHAEVSQVALDAICKSSYIAQIVGMHHGSAPSSSLLLSEDEIIGGSSWQSARLELTNSLKEKLQTDWPSILNENQAFAIAGLTTVSDWIASGSIFENLYSIDEVNIFDEVKLAVDEAGFISPKIIKNLQFSEIFDSYSPHETQRLLYEQVDKPGVYILEALMGSGKTEAAFYAAFKLLESGFANGIYFALPTKITSEKIFDRMQLFLDKILSPESNHSLLLAHGDSWLRETELGKEARPGYSWFDSRKRKLLAPFAVGTLDQALLSVMNVRHSFVRAFGLAGKVVILDEVHSYDSYTGTIMDYLISFLLSLGSTVILLSATLTANRKACFLSEDKSSSKIHSNLGYPLLSKRCNGDIFLASLTQDFLEKKVLLSISTDTETIISLVRQKALSGEYILWIENTVQEAQTVFKLFATWAKVHNIEIGLVHSRFPLNRRNSNETHWVNVFGKNNLENRTSGGKILIGTQVLEQSLDLDSDLLISKIAPTDMILQRIGRLWRHQNLHPNRPVSAKSEIIIIAPQQELVDKSPQFAFGLSGNIYSPYILSRSLGSLKRYKTISIPKDMRDLIESTYKNQSESNYLLNEEKYKLQKVKEKLQSFALQSLTSVGKSASDNVLTRYSEVPSCDVLLLCENSNLLDGYLFFIDGTKLTFPKSKKIEKNQKKELATVCMEKFISVPTYLAPEPASLNELGSLRQFLYISQNEEERLRVAILNQSGRIEGLYAKEANNQFKLEYSDLLGYSATKKEVK